MLATLILVFYCDLERVERKVELGIWYTRRPHYADCKKEVKVKKGVSRKDKKKGTKGVTGCERKMHIAKVAKDRRTTMILSCREH
jgi:hypothetical protein